MTAATVSHHLSVLKDAGLVFDQREGKYIYYILNLSVFEETMSWLQSFLGSGKSKKRSSNKTGGSGKLRVSKNTHRKHPRIRDCSAALRKSGRIIR
jgi:DNA-binding transcriptional ArsR family regulator